MVLFIDQSAIPVGYQAPLAVIFRFLDRKEARDTGEKLYEGASPETQRLIKEIVEGYRSLSEKLLNYFEAITDGLPNEDAPPREEARNTGPLPPGSWVSPERPPQT